MKRFFSIAAVFSGLFAAGNLYAMDVVSEKVTVPFDFKVGKATMRAGQYRIERDFGKPHVFLVNLDTGRRVQVLRMSGFGSANSTLRFETTGQGRKLVKVF